MPEAIRPVYIAWMGYLAFRFLFFFRTAPDGARLLGGRRYATLHGLALAGAAGFCVQTVLLDAIVWPLLFPRAG